MFAVGAHNRVLFRKPAVGKAWENMLGTCFVTQEQTITFVCLPGSCCCTSSKHLKLLLESSILSQPASNCHTHSYHSCISGKGKTRGHVVHVYAYSMAAGRFYLPLAILKQVQLAAPSQELHNPC